MKIGEVARLSGLSTHTIRYYERVGLLPATDRTASRHRDYDASVLERIAFLNRLKTTGMPIRDMLRFVQLANVGDATRDERREMLENHRDRVLAHLSDLESCLHVIERKIADYAGLRDGAIAKERIQT